MIRIAPLALATLLAASAPAYIFAQTPRFTDPANLRGERVAPRTGRELPIDQGTLGLEQLLRKLSTRASILNIVAHPDDEDGGMLTLYARGLGARVADLSLTRGEGGQNAVTADFEDALGLLRTQELLANDRYTGVDQFFGTEVDFGFSKTKSESFAKWNHQRVLYDVVRAIRLYRPLVLTSTWIGNPTDGHGQHQVAGEIAQEAFLAAGDPNVFPELTREGILPWQPLKIYARVPMQAITPRGLFDYATGQYVPAEFTNYVTGKTSTTPPTPDITIHEGTPDTLLTTCAANPSDLPPSLRSASTSSNPPSQPSPSALDMSSRPQPATNLSSRPKARSAGAERPASPDSAAATDCRPLTYVQFARIGLGLQRTQIGPGIRNAPSGRFDIPYHLYFSCISPSPASEKICHLDRSLAASSQGAAERPASPPAAALPPHPSGLNPHQAPTARNLPAQGNALGSESSSNPRAESPLYTPATQNPVILSEGSQVSSRAAVEGPRGSATSHNSPPLFHHGIQPPSAANEQSSQTPTAHLVLATFTPNAASAQAPTARNIPAQGVALGVQPNNESRAESPLHNPALATQPNFFDGIDTSIEGIATLMPEAPATLTDSLRGIASKINEAQHLFNPEHPERIAASLAQAETQLIALLAQLETQRATLETQRDQGFRSQQNLLQEEQIENVLHELRVKSVQLNEALRLSLGLKLDANGNRNDLSAGTATSIDAIASLNSPTPVAFFGVSIYDSKGKEIASSTHEMHPKGVPLTKNAAIAKHLLLTADVTREITRPYFSRPNIEQPFYDLQNPNLRNAPATPPAFVAYAAVEYKNQIVQLATVVHHGLQPVSVIPAASLSLSSKAQVFPDSASSLNISATLSFWPIGGTPQPQSVSKNAFSIIPTITLPVGWKASFLGSDGWWNSLYRIEGPPIRSGAITANALAILPNRSTISEGFRPVGYGDLPRTNFYTPATDRIVPVDLKLPEHRRIAYLPGTGDAVPEALTSIGLKPTILTVADLTPAKLAAFDTIILGVRTYNAHPDLHGAPTQALLDFARSGGNVVVQYQSAEFTAADAPFPLELGRSAEKVVDETAPVEILHADSTLFTTPNHIVTSDFDHWIEERGHGFLASWDPRYTALTETRDPGQLPQKGGLITVQLGRGHWTYCAFALYRQLPEAVPGAFRLFTNLLNP